MSYHLKTRHIPFWKESPFIRLILPFIAGIILQWYGHFPVFVLAALTFAAIIFFTWCYITSKRTGYRFGMSVYLILIVTGNWFVYVNDPCGKIEAIKNNSGMSTIVMATIDEPPVTKPNSIKAIAAIQFIDSTKQLVTVRGKIIIYLAKDSLSASLKYGDQLIFKKQLSEITNSGNPGAFDYRRYAAFNHLYFQVYLHSKDYRILSTTHTKAFYTAMYTAREFVIREFKKYIPGTKEAGLAEALLVGYKDDLDKGLVEDYANTGVVHIIAISGMHLGLIYGLLLFLLKPLNKRKYGKILSGVFIIALLWFFSFLTGAAPSITRSALMFSAIIVGNSFDRKISIYNSLAVSAFILLATNPFNLWDVGFQLSYAAVFSIAALGKPVTNWITFSNKIIQKTWQLIAVTIAAQIFTLPFVIYHFHQFPLLFIFSNLVAVPLSGVILYLLIFLLSTSLIPLLANYTGICCGLMIKWLNTYIGFIASISFSRIDSINISVLQAILLMIAMSCCCIWLLKKSSHALITSMAFAVLFFITIALNYFLTLKQRKLIIYNIPGKHAIDIIDGRSYSFIGDTSLWQKNFLHNFHLLPSRILHQVSLNQNMELPVDHFAKIEMKGQSILILNNKPILTDQLSVKVNYLVVTKDCFENPRSILRKIECSVVILDETVPLTRIRQWQIAVESLHLRLHLIKQQGAFEVDL